MEVATTVFSDPVTSVRFVASKSGFGPRYFVAKLLSPPPLPTPHTWSCQQQIKPTRHYPDWVENPKIQELSVADSSKETTDGETAQPDGDAAPPAQLLMEPAGAAAAEPAPPTQLLIEPEGAAPAPAATAMFAAVEAAVPAVEVHSPGSLAEPESQPEPVAEGEGDLSSPVSEEASSPKRRRVEDQS